MDNVTYFPPKGKGSSKRVVSTPGAETRKIFLYAQEIGYLENDQTHFAGGTANNFMLLYVVNSFGKVIFDGKEYPLTRDKLILIDCSKEYEVINTTKHGWRILYLYFNGRQARDYYNLITRGGSYVFSFEGTNTVKSLLWQILSVNEKNVNYAAPLTSLNITRILTEIYMFCINQTVTEAEYPTYINNVFAYIAKHYYEKITLDQLADLYFINKFHLAREFKRCAGTTVNEYIITTRINHAKSLLRYSEKSIGEIADLTGFCSASHLIKHFHKREGVTPLFYRNQWANK